MARVCPLCYEVVDTDNAWPHICKSIPMPTIGQCEKCGTALSDLNICPIGRMLCRSCWNDLPGNASEAQRLLIERGRVLLVTMGQWRRFLWAYVTGMDKEALDILRRTYGGKMIHHHGKVWRWECTTMVSLRAVSKALETARPELAKWMVRYIVAMDGMPRWSIVDDMLDVYETKCIHISKAQ